MEKKKMSNRTLMLILFPIMAIVVAALIFGNYMAMTCNTIISRFFNHQTYRIEKIDDSVQIDDQYYKSDFSDEAALTEQRGSCGAHRGGGHGPSEKRGQCFAPFHLRG